MRKIYEWIDRRGCGVVSDWPLQEEQQAKLEERLAKLRMAEVDDRTGKVTLPQSLLAGPMRLIYELKIHGRVALRPHLCLGPIDRKAEWTILVAAIERGNKLDPANAEEIAEERRREILADKSRRRLLWDEEDDATK